MKPFLLNSRIFAECLPINTNMINVSVIIVSYNTKDLTLKCIKSVLEEGRGLEKELIVVDNGSSDGSVEKFKVLGGKINLIQNTENLGFAKANNQAIKISTGKYILLLNSDTVVINGAIKKLINFAEKNEDCGAVVPKLLNSDGSMQASVFRLPTLGRTILQFWLGQKEILDKYMPEGKDPSEVESAVMAAFLITRKTLDKVGLLDERYFMFFEDHDYCRRIKNKNLKIYYLPSSNVIHYHGVSGRHLANWENQWRRLIHSSKVYHGYINHLLITFVIWTASKKQKLFRFIRGKGWYNVA